MTPNDPLDETVVSWPVGGIDVEATLTRPRRRGPFPSVIMVAGSGPTDRNWTTPLLPGANGSAGLLARALTDAGFVTLRYDKLASGPHARENAAQMMGKISLQSHLDELAGGVRLLSKRDDVDPGCIFVLTNSEGAIHALNYQTHAPDPPFAGLVLTAAPARPAGALARAQIAAQLAPVPGGEQLLAEYDAVMADFVAGRPVQAGANLPESLRNVILSVTSPANQPFARELWVTDPLVWLAEVTAPVLVVIGKKDIQVDWQTDGPLFEALAVNHPNITIVYPDDANHVLKQEPLDRSQISPAHAMMSYNAEGSRLDESTEKTITAWLRAVSD